MLAIERIDWTTLISFTSAGLNVADYTTIKKAVVKMFKEVYGSDIDVSTATADGIYVENYCLMINNILQSFKTLYASLNVNEAGGKSLDILAALTNVYRKAATKSTASLKVTLDSAEQTYTTESIKFVDQGGVTWTATAKLGEQLIFNPGEEQSILVTCDEVGTVRAPAGWIDRTVDANILMEVVQENPATVGSAAESDAQLRARRMSSVGTIANSVLEALVGSLYAIDGISDVKIYNNDTNGNITALDSTVIPAHNVYVLIRQQPNVEIADDLVGSTIYENMTPGIKTVGGNHSYLYTQYFLGQPITPSIAQNVYWQVVEPKHPKITLTLSKDPHFSSATTPEKIANAIIEYANQLHIGEPLTFVDVYNIVESADPLFNGRRTYGFDQIECGGNVIDFGQDIANSLDKAFDYSDYDIKSEDSSTIEIEIF